MEVDSAEIDDLISQWSPSPKGRGSNGSMEPLTSNSARRSSPDSSVVSNTEPEQKVGAKRKASDDDDAAVPTKRVRVESHPSDGEVVGSAGGGGPVMGIETVSPSKAKPGPTTPVKRPLKGKRRI